MRHMRMLLLSLSVLGASTGAGANDTGTRAVGPTLTWSSESLERFAPDWLHVKFVEGADVQLLAGSLRLADGKGVELDAVHRALGDVISVRRTFPGERERFKIWKSRGEAASGQPGPDLSLWFDVRVANDRSVLARTINALNALEMVEIAHPAPICETASIVGSSALTSALKNVLPAAGAIPDFSAQQDYLYNTPVGLDAPSAWAVPGGRGATMKFIDIELRWTHDHEDFNALNLFYIGGEVNPGEATHGTAVAGEVIGLDDGAGITGFASQTRWGTIGIDIDAWPNVPGYFLEAAEALDAGDVWLIELQMYPPDADATPMEWLQVNYDVIWTSSWALDVVCVEAGANGSQNLDSNFWQGVFDRDVRDSGAIMVGAGTPNGRVAEWFTNYGSRMDAHAWGSQIVTTGYGDLYSQGTDQTKYTANFGGTSGASPMVVGAALCLQGIARAELGGVLTPAALRTLITETGIPNLGGDFIGPRPDLGSAVTVLLESACPADLDGNGDVGFADVLILLAAWGGPGGDVDGDGTTGFSDLLEVLASWGPC